MAARRLVPDPDWFAFVRPGDVLQQGRHGSYRVVREVTRWQRVRVGRRFGVERGVGPLRFVVFTIRARSWTNRCYTVYDAASLKTLGFRHVGVRVKLGSEMDEKICAAIDASYPYILTANDVRGIA